VPTVGADSTAAYQRLVEQLAQMPHVVTKLLHDHESDSTGRCRGCTRGGTGYLAATYPCSLAHLARAALEYRQRSTR
jgi:hypothetical protein